MCYTFFRIEELFLDIPAVHVGNLIIVEPTLFSREPNYSLGTCALKIGPHLKPNRFRVSVQRHSCGDFCCRDNILAHPFGQGIICHTSGTLEDYMDLLTQDIPENEFQEVPDHLKHASYSGPRNSGRGLGYKYSHDYPGHYVKQQYMPKKVCYYEPTDLGHEAKIKEHLEGTPR